MSVFLYFFTNISKITLIKATAKVQTEPEPAAV